MCLQVFVNFSSFELFLGESRRGPAGGLFGKAMAGVIGGQTESSESGAGRRVVSEEDKTGKYGKNQPKTKSVCNACKIYSNVP